MKNVRQRRSHKQVKPKFSYQGKRLIAEWDNREVSRSDFLSIVMLGFWLIWTPVTLYVTYLFFLALFSLGTVPVSDVVPAVLFYLVWLVFGYVGVIGISLKWVLRWAVERIELDEKTYRHDYVNLPKWFSREWATDELTQIYCGYSNRDSITTLSVYCGGKRDMIAYWANNDFRRTLYKVIRNHADEIGIDQLV